MSLDPGARDPVILMELGDLVQQNALSDVPGSPHCPLVAAPDAAVSKPVVDSAEPLHFR
jgi:hypothetical protein